jgi:hypothetical protein
VIPFRTTDSPVAFLFHVELRLQLEKLGAPF